MRIVIGGLAGTGKSTLARRLASSLGDPMLSIGSLFRAMAEERGVPLCVIDGEALADRAIDDEIARRVYAYAEARPDCVIEGRFAWYVVKGLPDTFRLKLICDDVVRYTRLAVRDYLTYNQAQAETIEREGMLIARFAERSGVPNWNDDRHYDLVIDTEQHRSDELFELALHAIAARVHPV